MLAAPGGRDFPPSPPSWLELVEAGNNASLERLRRLLERQPDCGTIVKCDLASLALSHHPELSRWDPGKSMQTISWLLLHHLVSCHHCLWKIAGKNYFAHYCLNILHILLNDWHSKNLHTTLYSDFGLVLSFINQLILFVNWVIWENLFI